MSQAIDIDVIFRDTFLTVLQLRSGVTTADGVKLYQNAKYQVETVQKTLRESNFSKDDIDLITYAQCALLDETVMNRHLENTQDAAYQTWIGLPLQIHFFNSLEAGDKIFSNIKEILNQGRPNPVVLTSYHRILLLGFCGKYGKNIDNPERLEILQKLTLLINELNAYPMQIDNDAALLGQPTKKLWRPSRRFLTWTLVCISILAVVALWNFYDYSLNQQINRTIPNAPKGQDAQTIILNTIQPDTEKELKNKSPSEMKPEQAIPRSIEPITILEGSLNEENIQSPTNPSQSFDDNSPPAKIAIPLREETNNTHPNDLLNNQKLLTPLAPPQSQNNLLNDVRTILEGKEILSVSLNRDSVKKDIRQIISIEDMV